MGWRDAALADTKRGAHRPQPIFGGKDPVTDLRLVLDPTDALEHEHEGKKTGFYLMPLAKRWARLRLLPL